MAREKLGRNKQINFRTTEKTKHRLARIMLLWKSKTLTETIERMIDKEYEAKTRGDH